MDNILLLGSQSSSRQTLLQEAGISFELVGQDADETCCDWVLSLEQLVKNIAIYKMEHVILPFGKEGDSCFVLTADTLTRDAQGTIHGKPVDQDDALHKLHAVRAGASVGTAFCLDKKIFNDGVWREKQRIVQFVQADVLFDVPDEWIKKYFEAEHGLGASGGMRIEGFGSLFLKSIHGSYTTVVGLPMFQLRQALEDVGFWAF